MTGEPLAIPGLVDLAGEEVMNQIYVEVSESLKAMTVTEEIFLAILHGFPADSEEFLQIEEALYGFAPQTDATYKSVLTSLGNAEKNKPASINFYAKDFHQKENVEQFIADYNASVEEKDQLEYTDIIGIMMSSVTIIIDVISYVLIAFVAISLVVSSIMIGIITNISVLERTKEIGILRAIGASKRDISRVFNAETFIIGLAAGILGILMTVILCLPTNAIIQALTGFSNIRATLPAAAAAILIVISMGLTILAGLIPAKKASRKDPVIALRTE
jgi:putative ABC transport system permease protein